METTQHYKGKLAGFKSEELRRGGTTTRVGAIMHMAT